MAKHVAASRFTPKELLTGLDQGIEAHLAWSQRLLRCALLRESPGSDVLEQNAHQLCDLGLWLAKAGSTLSAYDARSLEVLLQAHRQMHDVVRSMCAKTLAGKVASKEELQQFESTQRETVNCLHVLRYKVFNSVTESDALTGLPLRHGLEHAFASLMELTRRSDQALWLVMADVDHFKSVNDTFGHPVGDEALQHMARVLSSRLRDQDLLIRYGGEEFLGLFLLPDTSVAPTMAQRILEAVRESPLRTETGLTLPLTLTMGWTRAQVGEGLKVVVQRADEALLRGKREGRDRYVLA